MTRVKCRRRDCIYWDEGVCGRDLITIDEEEGCVSFEEAADMLDEEDDLDWDADEEVPVPTMRWDAADEDDADEDWEEDEEDEETDEEEEDLPHDEWDA